MARRNGVFMKRGKTKSSDALLRIVSGGQTGVDRAALDVAFALGLPQGGYCPRGRKAEDGRIASHYPLIELESDDYAVRTERNVLESSGTLILYRRKMTGGTLLTFRLARRHRKPYFLVRLDRKLDYPAAQNWLEEKKIEVLNVAGPRGSTDPEIYELAAGYLWELLQELPRVRIT